MPHRTRLLAFVAALAVLAPSAPAFAQGPTSAAAAEEASSRVKKGVELARDGDYEAALIELRRAYDLAPSGDVLYEIGRLHSLLRDYPAALAAFERCLAEGSASLSSTRRDDIAREVAKLKGRLATLTVSVDMAGADIAVDGVPVGKSPLAQSLVVGVGRHQVVASRAGFPPVSRVVEVASADTVKVTFELAEKLLRTPPLAPVATATPAPDTRPALQAPRASGPRSRLAPLVGWLLTGGFVAGATGCGVAALGASSDLRALRASPNATRVGLDGAATRTRGLALGADLLAGTALVGAAVSTYLTVVAAMGPRVGVGPGSVVLSGRF